MTAYATLFFVAALASFAKTLIYAQLLEPAAFGVVSLALLLTSVLATPSTLGILDGLVREIPIQVGMGRATAVVRRTAFWTVATAACTVGLLTSIVCVLVVRGNPDLEGLQLSGAVLGMTVLFNALATDLQVREESLRYAVILLMKNALPLMGAPLLVGLGPSGILLAEVLAMAGCGALCLTIWTGDLRRGPRSIRQVGPLISVGLPFTLSSMVQNVSTTVDRWAVQIGFGVAAMGTYAFAMNLVSVGLVLVNMVSIYATPRLLRRFSEGGEQRRLLLGASRAAAIALVLLLFTLAVAAVAIPVLMSNHYAAYSAAIPLLPWIAIGTGAVTIGFFDILFRASGRGNTLLLIHTVVGAMTIVACAIGIHFQVPLVAYAMIFAAARVIVAVSGWLTGALLLFHSANVINRANLDQ